MSQKGSIRRPLAMTAENDENLPNGNDDGEFWLPDGLPDAYMGDRGRERLFSVLGITNRSQKQAMVAGAIKRHLKNHFDGSLSALGLNDKLHWFFCFHYCRIQVLESHVKRSEAEGEHQKEGILYPCFEVFALERISADDWAAEISDEDAEAILESSPFGNDYDRRLKKVIPNLPACIAKSYKILEQVAPALENFDSQDTEEQQNIVDAIFAVASLCNDIRVILEATERAPNIAKKFVHLLEKFEARMADESNAVDQVSSDGDINVAWKQSIEKISEIATLAKSAPPSKEVLQQLLEITRTLESRKSELPDIPVEYSTDKADKFVAALVESMRASDIIFDQRLVTQLLALWQKETDLLAADGIEPEVGSIIDSSIDQAGSLASDCRRIQDEISKLNEAKESVEIQMAGQITPGEARKLNTRRRDIQRGMALLEDERLEKHDSIWEAMSPPGRDFDFETDYLQDLRAALANSPLATADQLISALEKVAANGLAQEIHPTVSPVDERQESVEKSTSGGKLSGVGDAATPSEQSEEAVALSPTDDKQKADENEILDSAMDSQLETSRQVSLDADSEDEKEIDDQEMEEEQNPEPAPEYALVQSDPADLAREYLEGAAGQPDRHPVRQFNLLWAMVGRGYTLVAYWFLHSLENCNRLDPSLPNASLFKAAALAPYVNNMHGPAATLHLQAIREIDTDKHLSMLSSDFGKSLSCISVAATLQPSLFRCDAISLQILGHSAGKFDAELSKLLMDIKESADRGEILTLADFDTSQASQDYSESLAAIRDKVELIRTHAINKRTGYYWANIILRDVLIESEFASVITIIRKKHTSPMDLKLVSEVVGKYGTRRSLLRLLEDKRHQLQGSSKRSEKIVGDARNHFLVQCNDLIEQASSWLELHQRQSTSVHAAGSSGSKTKIERMRTILPKVIAGLKRELSSVRRLDEHAGLNILLDAVENVHSLVCCGDAKSFRGIDPDAWINLPRVMMGTPEESDKDPRLADELAVFAKTGFNYRKWCEAALENGNVRLADEVCDEIERDSSHSESDISKLRTLISGEGDSQNEAIQLRSTAIDRRIEEAFNAGLLPQSDYVEYKFEIEVVQNDLGASGEEYPDYVQHNSSLDEIEMRISGVTEEHLKNIRSDWRRYRDTAKRNKRLDDLPEGWEAGLTAAIDSGDVTVAEEYIQQFRDFLENNAEVFDYRNKGLSALSQFLKNEPAIVEYFKSHGIRDAAKAVRAGETIGNIDFGQIKERPTSVLQSLESLGSTPRKSLAEGDLAKLGDVLQYFGFQWPTKTRLKNLDSVQSGKMLITKIPLYSGVDDSPLPSFGSKHGEFYAIALIWKYRNLEEVAQFLQDNNCSSGSILLFLNPLDIKERKELASICHKERLTLLSLDPVALLFLSFYRSVSRRETVLRSVFKICLPFTFDNPYVDALYPPPQEMVFGRRKEIDRVLRPNGVAILYGGRQLGKSTILKEVESRLHKPDESSYAFYFSADADIGRDLPYETLTTRFWNKVASKLESARLIKQARFKSPDAASNALRELMARKKNLRITLLVDESDELLNIDSLHDFSLFRSFREHFYDSENRFRIVIAGLQNVQRFSNMPNNPLNQLGGSQPVTILPSVDGIRLIRDPLAILGFSFQEMTTVNRILAYSNNHPGLIQLFCHYLIEHLNVQVKNDRIDMPGYEITERDIEQTYQSKAIREGIVDRFNLTLRLDPRYRVLVYGFILENIKLNHFNVKEAKDIGDRYWPEEFRGMSTTKLRAILEEMVGLGVLIHETGDFNEDLYRFRNTNVFQLLGGDEIKRETIKEITEHINEDDPTLRHRLIKLVDVNKEKALVYSPLSLGDELELLGKLDARQPDNGFEGGKSADPKPAEVKIACIYGSTANGLGHIRQTLPWLSTLDDPITQKAYKLVSVGADKSTTIDSLQKYVGRVLDIAADNPVILSVEMPCFANDCSLYLEYLEFLYAMRRKHPKNSVWIILLYDPEATWHWLGNRNIKDIEADGIHIPLERWRKPALDRVLKDGNMLDGKKQIDFLSDKTGGWYGFVKLFADKALESDTVDDPEKLSRFLEIISSRFSDDRKARHGLRDIGVGAVDHMHDLLDEIVGNEYHRDMQLETIRLFVEEYDQWGFEGQEERILEWLIRMGILRATDTVDGRDHSESEMRYEIEPISYRLLTAVRENAA